MGARALRTSIEAGDFAGLAEAYSQDALLDAALPGVRKRARGPEAITATLAGVFAGPGRLIEWDEAAHDGGVAVWLERVGDDGNAVRQRHYLHTDGGGRIVRHWLYTARPRTASPSEPVPERSSSRCSRASASSPSAQRSPRVAGLATASIGSCSRTGAH
jgi:SnoaL-like domain